MRNAGSIGVEVTANDRLFAQTMGRVAGQMQSAAQQMIASGQRMQSAGFMLSAAVTAPMVLVGKTALTMAANAVESENLFNVAMKGMADKARSYSETMRASLGLNAYEVRKNVGVLFQMTTAMGITESKAYDISEGLTTLAYDMASFFNLPVEEAFTKIHAGLVGEMEPLRNIGILVDENTVKLDAYRTGIAEQGAELTMQQKILGRYEAMMRQTANAQGDMARTLTSPVNRMRVMSATVQQAAIDFGMALLPVVQAALPIIGDLAQKLSQMATAFGTLPAPVRSAFMALALSVAVLGPVVLYMGMMRQVMGYTRLAMDGLRGSAKNLRFAFDSVRGGAATLTEGLTFLAGGKLQLIMYGILGVAAVTTLLATHWKQFAAIATAAWNVVAAGVLYGASLAVRGVGALISVLSFLVPAFRAPAQAVIGYANTLKQAAADSLGMARTNIAAAAINKTASAADQAAKSGAAAAAAQKGLGNALGDTAAAAGKGIQSFDDVHSIQEAMAGAADATAKEPPGAATMPEGMDMGAAMAALFGGLPTGGDMFKGITDGFAQMQQTLSAGWQAIVTDVTTSWNTLVQMAYTAFPALRVAVFLADEAFQWVKTNWPTIQPVVETIAGVITTLLVPALIMTGVEAAKAGIKAVAAWIMQGAQAVLSAGAQLIQFALVGAKWVWLGIVAVGEAAKVVGAWVLQGLQAAASVAVQIGQFVLLGAKWVWAGIVAMAEGAKLAGAWVMQQGPAIAAVAMQVAQFVLLGAKWVWAGAVALASAAQMAAAWLISIWPIALVAAAVVGLVVLVVKNWEAVKTKTVEIWGGVTRWLSATWEGVRRTATTVWNAVAGFFEGTWTGIRTGAEIAWNAFAGWIEGAWTGIKTVATTLWEGIKSAVQTPVQVAIGWLESTWNTIAGTLEGIWNGVVSTASRVWEGIKAAVTSPINWVIEKINAFLDSVSAIAIHVPKIKIPLVGEVGGQVIGMPQLPHIPYLAEGGIATSPTLAMIGDRGTEAVLPVAGLVDDIAGAVYAAVSDAMRTSTGGRGTTQGQDVVLQLDSARFARVLLPALEREAARQGKVLTLRPREA